jgi:hypothetical protein
MDLKELVARWLKDEFPNWEITPRVDQPIHWIKFKPFHREIVWLYSDRIEFDDGPDLSRLVIMAHDTRFFELLWNRLHMMEQGFRKAMASRDFHRPESK